MPHRTLGYTVAWGDEWLEMARGAVYSLANAHPGLPCRVYSVDEMRDSRALRTKFGAEFIDRLHPTLFRALLLHHEPNVQTAVYIDADAIARRSFLHFAGAAYFAAAPDVGKLSLIQAVEEREPLLWLGRRYVQSGVFVMRRCPPALELVEAWVHRFEPKTVWNDQTALNRVLADRGGAALLPASCNWPSTYPLTDDVRVIHFCGLPDVQRRAAMDAYRRGPQ